MLGSPFDADDAVKETMVRAWRSLDRFDGRSSIGTWLYRIATNVCLDALANRSRRARPMEDSPAGNADGPLETRPRTHWIEPVPDVRVISTDADPSERAMQRQNVRLAFIAALQRLPPRQRAALLLTRVLGWSVAEVAATLNSSTASVNSALQRARATLATPARLKPSRDLSAENQSVVDRYVKAFEAYDVDALAMLLTRDAVLSMPPYTLWLRGPEVIRAWLLGRGSGCRGSRLVPMPANGSPAFAQYRQGGEQPWALIVLDLEVGRIAGMTSFLDVETLFPAFGLPRAL
jgi:RNA polymerase sigma-70 factor (ECF subfamily)